MSGVQQGLTMVVGPPGTGKTDTAVQIMHVLYHNQPEQRTLLITHSNQVSPLLHPARVFFCFRRTQVSGLIRGRPFISAWTQESTKSGGFLIHMILAEAVPQRSTILCWSFCKWCWDQAISTYSASAPSEVFLHGTCRGGLLCQQVLVLS